ncbi:MAG: ABC transporter substrate-binding protein [Lachnospiraceae bacterium]|nr:ABC transporter substrate-binding protein [Lachnospiraceae bacterium]
MNKKKKLRSKVLSVLLLFSFMIGTAGCGSGKKEECPYDEFIVVDVFNTLSNYQGIQSGWFAKIIKDRFNMEFNIVAPNVAGGGDTLFDTRVAAGNLGDIVIFDAEKGSLQDLVNVGLILDMRQMLADKDIMRYESAIRALNDPLDETAVYAIPSEISSNSPVLSSEALDLNYGPYLRWDLYAELGYPTIDTLEDLLPLLKKMQDLQPYSDSGKPTYAFSFFRDWDANLMNAAKQPACLYGYDEYGFLLLKADRFEYQSIIDEDSLYIRNLRLFFEANQLGLVDPESSAQNYNTLFEKYADGQILFSPWPWLGQAAYNTAEHTSAGKGFMIVPVSDMEVYSYGCRPEGNTKTVIAIGSGAQDPERLADFIDWLYSPEGIKLNGAQPTTDSTAGSEGLMWEMTEDGPVLTEFGKDALISKKEVMIPEEYGGGTWTDGVSVLNYRSVVLTDLDENGYPYAYKLWDSVRSLQQNVLWENWSRFMDAQSSIEYLTKNDQIIISPGCTFTEETETSEITTIRSQCKSVIVDYSWRMIFAEDEEEFNFLLKEMQDTVKSLGYEQVLEADIENAEAYHTAREASVEKYMENNEE